MMVRTIKTRKKIKDKSEAEIIAEIQVHLPTDTPEEQQEKTEKNLRISRIMHERKVRERRVGK
jgi:hypothetical protein